MVSPTTKMEFFQGKVKWFRPQTLNDFDKWTHVMYLNPNSLERLRELQGEGVKNTLKKDDDGWYTTFSRPSSKKIRGIVVNFAPPDIFDETGEKPWNMDNLIGNGSDVITKCESYEHPTPGGGKARAIRWLSSSIINYVPYKKEHMTEEQFRSSKGYDKQTPEIF